jgi:hypothetical protein
MVLRPAGSNLKMEMAMARSMQMTERSLAIPIQNLQPD